MKFWATAAAGILGIGTLAGSAQAANIPLTNNSFETPALSPGGFTTVCPSGWTCTGAGGEQYPSNTQFPAGANGLTGGKVVPDGNQTAYNEASIDTLSQFTAVNLVAGTTYTLDAFAGCRADSSKCPVNTWGNNVSIQILGKNGSTITVLNSLILTQPAQGVWIEPKVSYTATAGTAGQLLGVALVVASSGYQVNWDNVTLKGQVLPEPASLVLLGTGLAGLLWAGRRSRRNSTRS
jgi:hypothetical protein